MVMQPYYEREGITIYVGDNREVLPHVEPAHAVVTDPPYGLSFMGKGWDHQVPGVEFWQAIGEAMLPGAHLLAFGGTRTYHRMAVAIEDAGYEIRDSMLYWGFGSGFPKSHNVNKALESKGLACKCEGSAVPYNHGNNDLRPLRQDIRNVATNTAAGEESDVFPTVQRSAAGQGVGTARSQGQGGVDGTEPCQLPREDDRAEQSGMERRSDLLPQARQLQADQVRAVPGGSHTDGTQGRLCHGASVVHGEDGGVLPDAHGSGASHRPRSAEQPAQQPRTVAEQSSAQAGGAWPLCSRCNLPVVPQGLGTALKPSYEPVVVARKPLSEPTVAANVLAHGTGAINVDACRIPGESTERHTFKKLTSKGTSGGAYGLQGHEYPVLDEKYPTGSPLGRWPANVILDEAAAEALDAQSGERKSGKMMPTHTNAERKVYGQNASGGYTTMETYGDTGGASRFFYVAKASRRERNMGLPEGETSTHPTVKPLALMRYLIQMVTPPEGIVLDPFAGSGSTLVAAAELGFNAIGIELSEEYAEIAARRVDHALNGRDGKLPLELAAD